MQRVLIEQFRAGRPLEIDGRRHHWTELTDAQRARFSIDWLRQQLSGYMEGVK